MEIDNKYIEELNPKIVKLKKKLNLLNDLNLDNIDKLNEEELNEFETKFQEKYQNLQVEYQNGMKMIKETRERLMDDKLRCIICLNNQKNIVIKGCNHFDICDKCENDLPQKKCPRCQAPFKSVIKLNV